MTTQITPAVMTDIDQTNVRLLARQRKVRSRPIESASREITIKLSSPDAKRVFLSQFSMWQLHVQYLTVFARKQRSLDEKDVDEAEHRLNEQLTKQLTMLDQHLAAASTRCAENGITELATYKVPALEQDVAVMSSFDNRFVDLLTKLDQLMPMLETLFIDGHLSAKELNKHKSAAKRAVNRTASLARIEKATLQNKVRKTEIDRPARQAGSLTGPRTPDTQVSAAVPSDATAAADQPAAAAYADPGRRGQMRKSDHGMFDEHSTGADMGDGPSSSLLGTAPSGFSATEDVPSQPVLNGADLAPGDTDVASMIGAERPLPTVAGERNADHDTSKELPHVRAEPQVQTG